MTNFEILAIDISPATSLVQPNLSAQAERIIRQIKPGKREAIYLLIDDTRIRKRGKKMDAVSKIWDQKTHSFMRSHVVITAAICEAHGNNGPRPF